MGTDSGGSRQRRSRATGAWTAEQDDVAARYRASFRSRQVRRCLNSVGRPSIGCLDVVRPTEARGKVVRRGGVDEAAKRHTIGSSRKEMVRLSVGQASSANASQVKADDDWGENAPGASWVTKC